MKVNVFDFNYTANDFLKKKKNVPYFCLLSILITCRPKALAISSSVIRMGNPVEARVSIEDLT